VPSSQLSHFCTLYRPNSACQNTAVSENASFEDAFLTGHLILWFFAFRNANRYHQLWMQLRCDMVRPSPILDTFSFHAPLNLTGLFLVSNFPSRLSKGPPSRTYAPRFFHVRMILNILNAQGSAQRATVPFPKKD
jgi:hypothetical protein